ncbi:MAG: Smr/MutS family protein [Deltaproteobacteria bacterium]|nr:Smr/MutS family protein [Deltaproteobacteria bacterium]
MPDQRKSASHRQSSKNSKPVFDSPFRKLKALIREREHSIVRAGPSVANLSRRAQSGSDGSHVDATKSSLDDEALLRKALDGVRPIAGTKPERVGVEPVVVRNIVSEDAEVLAELSDLVSGQGAFELTETEDYLEGARLGLDPRLVSRLRRGDFSMQAHIDLHGMTQPDAKPALTEFILESVRKGYRAVLVVHGRGRRSPGGRPVLKHATAQWLSHGTIGGYVLAFTTARMYDGGAGAVWVLLRRERKRGKFDILQGARRRD